MKYARVSYDTIKVKFHGNSHRSRLYQSAVLFVAHSPFIHSLSTKVKSIHSVCLFLSYVLILVLWKFSTREQNWLGKWIVLIKRTHFKWNRFRGLFYMLVLCSNEIRVPLKEQFVSNTKYHYKLNFICEAFNQRKLKYLLKDTFIYDLRVWKMPLFFVIRMRVNVARAKKKVEIEKRNVGVGKRL